MRIRKVRARNIGFSRSPLTLKRNLINSASIFEDFETRPEGWFGRIVCTLVEVETEDGCVGIGTAGAFQGGSKSLIEQYYADLLVGQDPTWHEYLWQRMYRTTIRFGRSGSAMAALSALDIACWDLHGKAESKPVHALLGGPAQTRVPCYVSRLYALEDLDQLADEARRWKSLGFTFMKQRFGFGPKNGRPGMHKNAQLVRTVREAIGDEIELAADAYMGWDFGYTLEMAALLRDYRLSWIEEPLMPHEVESYAELKRRCPWQRWSCGEHSYGKWDFKDLLDRRAVDVLQPDANRTGGITEMVKICALAEAAGLPVMPHSNEAHNTQVVFSRAAHVCPRIEYFPNVEPDTGNELFWRLYKGVPEAEDGWMRAPDQPGLGIEINEEVAKALCVD